MVKQYVLVSNEQRQMLIQLIHKHNYSISHAAKIVDIYYPTAKAINKVFMRENRIEKKTFRSTIQNNVEQRTQTFSKMLAVPAAAPEPQNYSGITMG